MGSIFAGVTVDGMKGNMGQGRDKGSKYDIGEGVMISNGSER